MTRTCNILLLGSNESAGLEVCRSLGRLGHRITILRFSDQKTPADYSRFCTESLYLGSPNLSVGQYISKLGDLLSAQHFDYLIPIDSLASELVYYNYNSISSLTTLFGPLPEAYAVANNRFEALSLAKSVGLITPDTLFIKQGDSFPQPNFPCVIRPIFSVAIIEDEPQHFSIRKVNSPDQMDAKLRDDLPRSDVLIQETVEGYTVELNFCAVNGNILGASVTMLLHESYKDTRSSYAKSEEVTPDILAFIQGIAHKLNWTGFMVIKCKRHKDRLIFMEMESCPSDSIALSYFSGIDFPKLMIDGLKNMADISIAFPTRSIYSRKFRKDIVWLLRNLLKKSGIKRVVPWLGSFLRLLTGHERLEIEQLGDPLPAIRQFDSLFNSIKAKIDLCLFSQFSRAANAKPDLKSIRLTSSLLIVCKGNINRSMVAEQLMKARGFTHVRSAGLLGMSGRKPSKFAEDFVAERLGVETAMLRSLSVTRALRESVDEIDMVFCFERRQIAELITRFPELERKVFLFSKLANLSNGAPDIDDPHGATEEIYRDCFKKIDNIVDHFTSIVVSKGLTSQSAPK